MGLALLAAAFPLAAGPPPSRIDSRDVGPSPPANDEARRYLEHALDLIEQRALHADRVDWRKVRERSAALARRVSEPAQTHGFIRSVLAQLADGHSFLMSPSQAKRWTRATARNPTPDVRLRFGGVGYVAIPAYDGNDPAAIRTYAIELRDRLVAKAAEARCGFVVDLRGNHGGNMWPMLGGLAPLLGQGTYGYFVDRRGTGTGWSLQGGELREGSTAWIDLGGERGALTALPPVAVLTSGATASSGEAVAISFRQRPRSRSFGQPTRGLSTANDELPLGDGAILVLTVAVMADRTGRLYGGQVVPDVITTAPGADANDRTGGDWDATFAAAVRWLKDESGCDGTARGS